MLSTEYQEHWDRTGLTDIEGNLGRRVPSGRLFVPGTIDVVGDNLRWECTRNSRIVEISRSTLNDFVDLWRGDSAEIVEFARRWGVLAIQLTRKRGPLYRPCNDAVNEGEEPIHAWKYYSRRAAAVLSIAAALNQERLGDLDDWRRIAVLESSKEAHDEALKQHRYGLPCYVFDYKVDLMKSRLKDTKIETARNMIATEAQRWLDTWRDRRVHGLSDFAVRWYPLERKWKLQVDYHGYLFSAIAFQLALCIVGTDSLFICSGCGGPYQRELKRPKPGVANYCPACTEKGVAQRNATDAYRQKKREALQLQSAGATISEIARKLKADESRVQKWCGESIKNPARRVTVRSKNRKRGGDPRK